jgi:competence protein ComEC
VKRFIVKRTSRLFESSTGRAFKMVLIFGDEVEVVGPEEHGRVKAMFRARTGWVKKDHLGAEAVLEVYFIDVGQGDSTFIVTPARKKILIDGGIDDRALRFLAWKYRLAHVDPEEPLVIDLMVMSHADEDHIGGLIPIISHPKVKVKRIVHSGLATFKSGVFDERLGELITEAENKYIITKHDALDDISDDELSSMFLSWKEAIKNRGDIEYHSVDASSSPIDVGDPEVKLEVLGPRLEKHPSDNSSVYRWFGDHSHTINGHSVILKLVYKNVSFLFSGDLNIEGAKHLLEDNSLANRMDAHVLKAPHHGSQEYHRPWLESVNPQLTVISSGDAPDHGHPRANFIGTIGQSSRSREPLVFSTEIAATFQEAGRKVEEEIGLSKEEREALDYFTLAKLRKLFKRTLNGMINVRTDGKEVYSARRVATGYWWESYGPIQPTQRS